MRLILNNRKLDNLVLYTPSVLRREYYISVCVHTRKDRGCNILSAYYGQIEK